MEPKIWIEHIEFSNGTKISFANNDIILLVAPNNAGKSATLKEALGYLTTANTKGKVLKSSSVKKNGTLQNLINYVEKRSVKEGHLSNFPYYRGLGFYFYRAYIEGWWNSPEQGLDELSKLFAKYLTTEERLTAANPAFNIKLLKEAAKHPINFLQKG
ncbi:MAG TPA: hypothetical protein VD993_18745 [Chitinophagaceae bacterium]|nr:hypothetical protein [Chitinophagaceae bacterium]